MGKLAVLLALLVFSVCAQAQGYTPWRYSHSEWIEGRAHFLTAYVSRGVNLTLLCHPKATRPIQLRWEQRLPPEGDLRAAHISYRVDGGSAQRLSDVRLITLEGGDRVLYAPLLIGGNWAQAFQAGRQMVIQVGAEVRVPSGSWFVPDKWEQESTTETVSLAGFTAAYNSLPQRCRQAPSPGQ